MFKSQQGTTLIELLIYIMLTAFIISSVLVSAYQILQSADSLDSKNKTEAEADFILRKIEWALSDVNTIDSPAAGNSSSTLLISRINYPNNPIVFSLSNNSVTIKENGSAAVALSSQAISISNLIFQHVAAIGSVPEAIRASFSINSNPYQTTIYLKK
jgi:hypothetical protein